ncbi:MAG: hypothetical protein V1872_06445 [bacterium]
MKNKGLLVGYLFFLIFTGCQAKVDMVKTIAANNPQTLNSESFYQDIEKQEAKVAIYQKLDDLNNYFAWLNIDKDILAKTKEIFVNVLSEYKEDFELCEVYSKSEDKPGFLDRTFKTELFSQVGEGAKYLEIFVKQGESPGKLHLGIIALRCSNDIGAKKIYDFVTSLKQEYFGQTKVLTKYIIYQEKDVVLFVYSETFLEEKLKRFFRKFDETLIKAGDNLRGVLTAEMYTETDKKAGKENCMEDLKLFDKLITKEFVASGFKERISFSFEISEEDEVRSYTGTYQFHMEDPGGYCIVSISVAEAGRFINLKDYEQSYADTKKNYADRGEEYLLSQFPEIGKRAQTNFFGVGPGGSAYGITLTTSDDKFDVRIAIGMLIPYTLKDPDFDIKGIAKRLSNLYDQAINVNKVSQYKKRE